MSNGNDIIHQAMRLKIMAALNALAPKQTSIEFTRLKTLVGATDGNLGAHLETLEKAATSWWRSASRSANRRRACA
jgi:Winged helix DNA-binding domain